MRLDKMKFAISTCAFLQFPRQEKNTDKFLSRIPPHEIVVLNQCINRFLLYDIYHRFSSAHGSKTYDKQLVHNVVRT